MSQSHKVIQPALDFFNTDLERQIFESRSQQLLEQKYLDRQKRQSKRYGDLLSRVDLNVPLFDLQEFPFLELEQEEFLDHRPPVSPSRYGRRVPWPTQMPVWVDDEILKLKSSLLTRSLQLLSGRGNGEEKREILEWLDADDIVGSEKGRLIFIEEVEPFSFRHICKLEGIDPDSLRDAVFNQIKVIADRFKGR